MSSNDIKKVVLAKRPKNSLQPDERETLKGHTNAVIEAFGLLFGNKENPTRLTLELLRFFKLDVTELPAFIKNGIAACAFHDIGKANSGFQNAVSKKGGQVIYHEHLSGLILLLPEIYEWINETELDSGIIIPSVISHHLRINEETIGKFVDGDYRTFEIYKPAIGTLSEIAAKLLGIKEPAINAIPSLWTLDEIPSTASVPDLLEKALKFIRKIKRELKEDKTRQRILMSVRTALILADSSGSGLVRENKPLGSWIKEAFNDSYLLDNNAIVNKVIQPRIDQINSSITNGRPFFQWQDFQLAADNLPSRTLLLAACGCGKTLAAWRWIAAQAGNRPVTRVIFLYPTRATATEGFRDYVAWAPETDAALIHGTSEYELFGMFENPEEKRYGKDFSVEERLFGLAYWNRRIFSATVDQFLGFMQYSYRSMCLIPVLADSVVVFDEVHSFDESLFSTLMRFIKEFDLPVLCMTATLPAKRIKELEQTGLTVFPQDPKLFKDLSEREQMPRYQIIRLASQEEALKFAKEHTQTNRILWVVNQIARCQQIAMQFGALCYHSRFKLEHRKEQHEKVVRNFKKSSSNAFAVTTQVCEMSLDLDADILITEEAPLTALIQRMGRCNRHAIPGDRKTGTVIVYPPVNMKPYDEEAWAGVEEFLKDINGKTVSQSMLAVLLEKYGPHAPTIERYAAFLESGPWAMGNEESLRDTEDFTIQVILDSDIEEFLILHKQKKPVDGLYLPVPKHFAIRNERTGVWPLVAKSEHYHLEYGFMDKPLEENT